MQNSVKNSPITKQNIKVALDMLRYSIAVVKGSTAQLQLYTVGEQAQVIGLFHTIIKYYGKVELSVDRMRINRIPLLATILRKNFIVQSTYDIM